MSVADDDMFDRFGNRMTPEQIKRSIEFTKALEQANNRIEDILSPMGIQFYNRTYKRSALSNEDKIFLDSLKVKWD